MERIGRLAELNDATLRQICRACVHNVVAQYDLDSYGTTTDVVEKRVAGIVLRNIASGRARRVLAGGRASGRSKGRREVPRSSGGNGECSSPSVQDTALAAYVDQVTETYLREHRRVEALVREDAQAWNDVFKQVAARAYSILCRYNVPAARARTEAQDDAQHVCEIIFKTPFPYDVSFDAWTTVILRNCILQRRTRSPDLMDRENTMMSLDRPSSEADTQDFSLYQLLEDASSTDPLEQIAVQEWLLQAIGRLPSDAQQQVIIDTYFYGIDSDEIACRLGRSTQAVYNLRHRALKRLRKILSKNA